MISPRRLPERLDGAAIFSEAAGTAGLMRGWERCWRNGGAAGGDGQTLASFAVELGPRLVTLSQDLRCGAYRPGPLREVAIPKANGRELRRLRIPPVRDRVVQSSLAQVLTPLLDREMEDGSFGYRPGRGVAGALALVQRLRREGYVWTIDADIDDFFDTIPIDPLMERVHQSISESPASELISLWLEQGARNGRGLAQGSPLSPLLANLYLDGLDETFTRKGLRIVRYADDFVILAKDRPRAEDALAELGTYLARHGLALNRDKAALRDFDSTVEFLGKGFMRSFVFEADNAADDGETGEAPEAESLLRALALSDAAAEAEALQAETTAQAQSRAGHDPALRVLAVREPGRRLTLRNMGFAVTEAEPGLAPPALSSSSSSSSPSPSSGAARAKRTEREIASIHHTRIDRIELGPEVSVDGGTLRHALACAIPVAFTNGHGETQGHLAPVLAQRAGRHLAQARHVLDPALRLDLARICVGARLANQRALLRRINQRRSLPAVATAAHAIGRQMRRLAIARSVEELMGYEGLATALYWRAFDRLLMNGFKLEGRTRRRNADPVNAALDLAVSLLERDIGAVLLARGLHPGFGALHVTSDRRDACVYDLMEVFRAGLPESLILTLVNTHALTRTMFAPLSDGTVRMGAEAQRVIIRAYEARAASTVLHPRLGQKMTWRRVMLMEAEAYAAHVEGRDVWSPFLINY